MGQAAISGVVEQAKHPELNEPAISHPPRERSVPVPDLFCTHKMCPLVLFVLFVLPLG